TPDPARSRKFLTATAVCISEKIAGGGNGRPSNGFSPHQAAISACESCAGSPIGTSTPCTPGSTISSTLAPCDPITGTPSCRLSRTVFGRLSQRVGATVAIAPRTTAYNSDLRNGPHQVTFDARSPQNRRKPGS